MFRITEGRYALGGLTVFAVWSLTDADLPGFVGVIPMGAQVPQGSEAITQNEVAQVSGDKYLYVWEELNSRMGLAATATSTSVTDILTPSSTY